MRIDPRFLTGSGREVFNGNELLVKGCLEVEGGVHLLTGYPGSPVAGFFDVLGDISELLREKGVRAFQSNNEALSVAAVNGSQMAPLRAITAFKSVGVHVASDALALGNLGGPHPQGGAVIVCGDDPWCDSTQVPADSRLLCEHLRMPVVEPGTVQQLKDWIDLSFKLSRQSELYVGYIVTTVLADGGGNVECRPNQFPKINTHDRLALETSQIDLGKVLLPPRTVQKELDFPRRHALAIQAARKLGLNAVIESGGATAADPAPIGFIVTGVAESYLRQVLTEIGLTGRFPVLRMGMPYPCDIELARQFSQVCRRIVVIEERRSFLEKHLRDGLFKTLPGTLESMPSADAADIAARLFGKTFPDGLAGIPEGRGLNPSLLSELLIPLIKGIDELPPELRNGRLTAELELIRATGKRKINVLGAAQSDRIIPRTATFCPGCPHRDSSALLLEVRKNLADPLYMKRMYRRGPIDLVAHGDTGCYTMLMFPPTEQLMHNYSGMGLGGGTGSGIDPFISNKQIVFMGDGTFFHSGAVAISNAIKAGQDITFIILENKTTAMTGHQEHAGTEVDLLGNRSYIQDIEKIVRGMKGNSPLKVEKANPADRAKWKKVLERTILADGVKVLIADKECGITFHRRKGREERAMEKKHGFLPRKTHMNITPEVCENCLECTKQTACPGLTTIDTDYGRKIDTDLTWCVNDGACERVRVSNDYGTTVKPCPSFEQVTVVRKRRRRYLLPHMGLGKLPDPEIRNAMNNPGDTWRAHLAGVGGMGIGIVSAILVRAGHNAGYRVVFADKKGLAIRNGGVYSQITWIAESQPATTTAERAATESERAATTTPERAATESERAATITAERAAVESERAATTRLSSSTSVRERTSEVATRNVECTADVDNATRVSTDDPGVTGLIPYGKADLLLGIDILEATRAIDPREQFRVANPQRTAAVLNVYKQPTVSVLLGKADYDPEKLREDILEHCRVDHSFARNLSELCEQRLGSKQFVNIMMLGVAYQMGLIPASAGAIASAIRSTIRRDQRKNIKAFNIGRKIALEPRTLPNRPEPKTWQQLVIAKSRILRRARWRGATRAARFEELARHAVESMPALSDDAKYDLVLRVYDLLQYENAEYAKRFVDRVRGVYSRDSSERRYEATVAAIWNLAKVMLIKDEPYVSYLLTRYEKKQRDIVKYGIDTANGDKLIYRHHTSPEFPLPGGRRLRLRITTRDWQLKLMAQMTFLRKLPGWHRRETTFRDWYESLLSRVSLADPLRYEQALRVLKCPEQVSGYREVRYPKMDEVRRVVELDLANPPRIEVSVAREALERVQQPAGV
jgi:TPP-dependent indolepyruvate ferredoxin oxidoreductase alpha subunit/Pyruvate/2-oxoacid:ferredoxin oxidoreductase gamma subunit